MNHLALKRWNMASFVPFHFLNFQGEQLSRQKNVEYIISYSARKSDMGFYFWSLLFYAKFPKWTHSYLCLEQYICYRWKYFCKLYLTGWQCRPRLLLIWVYIICKCLSIQFHGGMCGVNNKYLQSYLPLRVVHVWTDSWYHSCKSLRFGNGNSSQ